MRTDCPNCAEAEARELLSMCDRLYALLVGPDKLCASWERQYTGRCLEIASERLRVLCAELDPGWLTRAEAAR